MNEFLILKPGTICPPFLQVAVAESFDSIKEFKSHKSLNYMRISVMLFVHLSELPDHNFTNSFTMRNFEIPN